MNATIFRRATMSFLGGPLLVFVLLSSLAPAQTEAPGLPHERWPALFGARWMKVSVLGSHVGWLRRSLERRPDGTYVETETGEFQVMGDRNRFLMESRFAAEPPHRLLSKRSVDESSGGVERAHLRREDGGFVLVREAGGKTHSLKGLASKEVLDVSGLPAGVGSFRELKKGQSWTLPGFDLEAGRDTEITRTFLGGRTLKRGQEEIEVGRIRESESGLTGTNFVDERGVIHRMLMAGLLAVDLTTEAEATKGVVSTVDLLKLTSAELAGVKRQAPEIEKLSLRISGLDRLLASTGEQRVAWEEKGETQRVERVAARAPRPEERTAEVPEKLRRFLAPDPLHPSDHPEIVALAEKLTKGTEDRWERTARVCAWVDRNIEDDSSAEQSSALAILTSKKGDCTEHAALAIALLRAAGIPARRAMGWIAAYETEEAEWPALFGHAWVQVWIGRWIPVDPTWGLVPATGGYVTGATGSEIGPIGAGMKAVLVEATYRD